MREGKRERAKAERVLDVQHRMAGRAKAYALILGPRGYSSSQGLMHPHGTPQLDWAWLPRPHVHVRKLSARCFKPA